MLKIGSWSKSPSYWIDPFQTKLDKRRTTKITRTAEPMLRDVIELKQAALWHGGKIRIDQACEAAAEGMARQPKAPRISLPIRRDQIIIRHSSRAHNITADFASTILRIIVVRSGIASNEWWNVSRTEFNGCKPATVRCDLKEPVVPVERSHEERVTFRWHRFLSLTYFVVTASTAQFCLMTQDEIRERKLREAQETTGGWAMRISDCPHSIEQRAFRESAYLEWMTCLSCGARWSRKTGRDDIQVKMGLTIEQPQPTPPSPGCASTTRQQQMTNKTETFFGCSRFTCANLLRNHVFHRLRTRVQQLSPRWSR